MMFQSAWIRLTTIGDTLEVCKHMSSFLHLLFALHYRSAGICFTSVEGSPRHLVLVSRLMPGVYMGMISAGNASVHLEPASFHHGGSSEK